MIMVKILVADDHAIVREGLKQILADTDDIHVAGEASCSQQVLDMVRSRDFDLVLLDISMPGLNGLDTVKLLKKEKPNLKMLVLSIHPEDQYAVRAIKAGASGYLTKESDPEVLISAIRDVARGGKYISRSLSEQLVNYLSNASGTPTHEILSDREYQVVMMIAQGKTVSQIADELSLSVKTISTNRTRALRKMGMKTNAELTHYAFKQGLIS